MSEKDDKSLEAALAALKKSRRSTKADISGDAKTSGSQSSSANDRSNPAWADQAARMLRLPGFGKIVAIADLVWNGWAKPFTRFLSPITRRVWRFYGWSYEKFAHTKAPDETRVFSRQRAAMVTVVLAIITVFTPVMLVRDFIPALSRTIYDAGMLATMREDHLFLGRAELINPDREIFQVMGCRDIRGCDGGDNTTYYRLRDNVILDIKYWTTRFEPYDPAEIAGAMVSELNDCKITYYGRRSKALGWFPYIVSASCTPV